MMEASLRGLGYCQILFVGLLSIMIAIRPDVYFGNAGVSEFEILPCTAALFVMAFLVPALSMWKVAGSLVGSSSNLIRAALRLSAVLIAGLVVFPAIGDGAVDTIHIVFAVILFSIESLFAIWLTVRSRHDKFNVPLLAILVAAALMSLLSLCRVLHCKTEAETAFQLVFNILLQRCLRLEF